jgi:hypothetical protein
MYLILGLAVAAPAIAAGQPVTGRQQPAQQMRRWTDITGRHSVVAQLAGFANGIVQLTTANEQIL